MWNHKGKFQLVTKDEGYGVMIFALQYQVFGFEYPSTVPDIQTIDEYTTIYPKYDDMDAATTILGNTCKAPINMGRNNFWQEFEYGASYEVYCTYERIVLQLKYRSRIFKALHPVIYFIYIYDN